MAFMDREATSGALSQELGSFARQQVSARTVCRSMVFQLGDYGCGLPLTLHHRQERLQWCDQRRTWTHERRDVILSDESRFCLPHQDCRILIRRHHGERALAACIRHRHTGPSPGVMIWGSIGYTFRSPLARVEGTLNSARYISGVLRPVTQAFIRALRNPTFKQDNARLHVAGIVRTFLDTESVQLLPWPAHSPYLLPIENVWFMVAERLACHHTVDELWRRVEAAWASVPVFDSMPRRISAVITARGGCSGY
ncbi:transposable element Tcb1 transposase [Trichonephila clavipes]|nr:transposable element Tcb1 transposase [Trichonephila clavipes]